MGKLKIGVFGLWRGMEYVRQFHAHPDTEIWAVCDSDEKRVAEAAGHCGNQIRTYKTYDELLESGVDAVVLCNYFNEHAPAAIKAMERGIDVLSECTAGSTLRECVELVEAVERTGRKYMLAENYPFSRPMREITNLVKGGTLGRILYAEGEYNHTATREDLIALTPGKTHWRAYMPRTYYCTHALGPLMYATGEMPVSVSAYAVHSDVLYEYNDVRHNYDAIGMMNCITDDGALFRFTGCTAMGSRSGYRIVGENGSAETGRAVGDQVYLTYQPWLIPDGKSVSQLYAPNVPEPANGAGHGGGDYFVATHFVNYLKGEEDAFFDVYRSATMSAVGILGWRSCLENGKPYRIPDFRDPAQREPLREDALSPFPDENGNVTLPCALPLKK